MSYDWPRNHKVEDNLMMEINEIVWQHVLEHFGVDEITEITEDQIKEIEEWREENLHEYSVLQVGFSNFIQRWESETWELENE